MANCRGCGRLIVWTKMQSGKPMPCDPEIIRFSPKDGGPEVFVTPDGRTVYGLRDPQSEQIGYISHFATCPMSKQFKKG